jgi:hypothetical protein
MLTNVKPAAVETNASKRARVLARLHEPDAATMSQRALARELGVTQPFICKVRTELGGRLDVARVGPVRRLARLDDVSVE